MILTIYFVGFVLALVCITVYMKETDQGGRVTAQDLVWCLLFAGLWWAIVPIIVFWEFLKLVSKVVSK